MASKAIIVGGHGKVALRLAPLLAKKNFNVTSIIRDPAHARDVETARATPHVLSLEDAPVSALASLFHGAALVYFSAGAGGKGGSERTKAVDYDGAVKVFDAVEQVEGQKPRVILVGAIDTRDPEKLDQYPSHYNETDIAKSKQSHAEIPVYYKWKYEADKNLSQRTAFKWFILRPSGLTDGPGTGKVALGKTRLTVSIPRDDVATTLAALADRPDAHGLALDLVGGETPIAEALDNAIAKGESDFFP